jgi:hypothetical protein
VLADVAQTGGAEHRIDQRMQQYITVGVRDHTARVGNAHAAEDDAIAGTEGMHVEP